MYKKVELKENGFVGLEHEVKDLWDKKDIIHKILLLMKVKDILLFMMDHQQLMENHMLGIF